MKTNKTYEEIENFLQAAGMFLNNPSNKTDTKFAYALRKVDRQVRAIYKRFADDVEDVNLEFAATDEKGILLREERTGGYRYTKDDARKRLEKVRDLKSTTVEIEPHFADAPEGLNPLDFDPFIGFVLKEEQESPKLEVVS